MIRLFLLLLIMFLTSQSGIATTVKFTTHQYDVNPTVLSDEIYGYDNSSNHQNSHLNRSSVKVQDRSLFAFVSDFLATKGTAGSIRNVNPLKGTQNCVNCSIATDATLAGRPASALSGSPTSIRVLEKQFGGSFGSAISRSGVENSLLNAGNGARGIVFGSRGSQTGHVFNVVNQKGTIRFLDGQTGKPASIDGFQSLHLLRTN